MFSSGLQAIAIQIIGVVFFLITARFLPKSELGLFNWSNAISTFVIIIVGLGLEQSVTRRIAMSKNADWVVSVYFIHTILVSAVTIMVIFFLRLFLNDEKLSILPYVFIGQAVLYLASPFKQFLNAKERYTPYGVISTISNLAKIIIAVILIITQSFDINKVIYTIIGCSAFELMALYFYVKAKMQWQFIFKRSAYFKLVKESIPLYISAIFDSSLSRMDWILLGFLSTGVITAEYSFAYRGYEVAKLPLQIIGLVILPKFIRFFPNEFALSEERKKDIHNFLSLELFFAFLIILSLNIIWQPWISYITNGKYGSSNALIFFIVSLCLPLHFFINMLWTLCYAGKKYKQISSITIFIAIINIVLNIALIPFWGGLGAAIAYLSATFIQAIAYYYIIYKSLMHFSFTRFISFLAIGVAAYFISTFATQIVFARVLIAIVIYLLLSVLLKQVNKEHLQNVKFYLKR